MSINNWNLTLSNYIKLFFSQTIGENWIKLSPIRLGIVPINLPTPDDYLLLEKDGIAQLRIDIYIGQESCVYKNALIWNTWLVVGIGEKVYFIDINDRHFEEYRLEAYFCALYTKNSFKNLSSTDDLLLIASATDLLRFDINAKIIWHVKNLGIDGVIVKDIYNSTVIGVGDWDPPCGWKKFKISLNTGSNVYILPDL